jgi:type II secretory pathway pseudopilin PulG
MQYFKSNFNIQNKKGFTIVETLVAIAVLMIAIAGPLVIASKGLTSAIYSKDQMIASFLAQESMEIIKNLRDSGIVDSGDWMSKFTGNCDNGKECDADPFANNFLNTTDCVNGNTDGCQIYINNSGYTSNGSQADIETKFSRYFTITNIGDGTKQKLVKVVVNWQEGTIPFRTELTSLITAELR